MLHVTNGDHAVAMLRRAGMQGDILPWRDVLHEGPVPAGRCLAGLSDRRARFIADAGWGDYETVRDDFRRRDERLMAAANEDEVVLWFEHDLYDQLQLLQILDALASVPPRRLTLVCEAEYLGTMAPARAASLYALRNEVANKQLLAAQGAWAAFRSADPREIPTDLPELRFAGAALLRLLEEYPWTLDGLSRLERAIFQALRGGPLPFMELFRQLREEPAFLGDAVLLWHLRRLASEDFLSAENDCWRLTGASPRRRCERWLGGAQALPRGRWRFDPALGRVVVE